MCLLWRAGYTYVNNRWSCLFPCFVCSLVKSLEYNPLSTDCVYASCGNMFTWHIWWQQETCLTFHKPSFTTSQCIVLPWMLVLWKCCYSDVDRNLLLLAQTAVQIHWLSSPQQSSPGGLWLSTMFVSMAPVLGRIDSNSPGAGATASES